MRLALRELDVLHVVAGAAAVEGELAADDLDHVGVQAVGELVGGLAGGVVAHLLHGALDELARLEKLGGLAHHGVGDVVLADADDRLQVMRHAAELSDLLAEKCHVSCLSHGRRTGDGKIFEVFRHTIPEARVGSAGSEQEQRNPMSRWRVRVKSLSAGGCARFGQPYFESAIYLRRYSRRSCSSPENTIYCVAERLRLPIMEFSPLGVTTCSVEWIVRRQTARVPLLHAGAHNGGFCRPYIRTARKARSFSRVCCCCIRVRARRYGAGMG